MISQVGILTFVEYSFLTAIFINLLSYLLGAFWIVRKKLWSTFWKTIKEAKSKKYISENIMNGSLLLTTIAIFWTLFYLSKNQKDISMQEAFHKNIYVFIYICISCLTLVGYSFYIALKNRKRIQELLPVLGYLSIWNNLDSHLKSLGWGIILTPVTSFSTYLRKHLIVSELTGLIISSIVWLLLEYIFKLVLVLFVMYILK